MGLKGTIEPNYDRLEELFEAVVSQLAGTQAQLAVWLIQNELDLSSIKPQPIGASSPLQGSDSELAGSGLLIKLDSSRAEKVIQLFTADDRLGFEVMHLEIEAKGSVQFKAYDHFAHVFFGDEIPLAMLDALKSREVIDGYALFDDER